MARTKISEFSATAADNTDIDNINIAEGCAPSGINNAIREMMAQLKDFQTGSAGDPFNGAVNGSVGATTPSTVVATQVDITAQGDLRLQDTTGGQYVALQAPGTVATSYTLTLPVDDGTSGQALITDGSGVLSWSSAASGDVYGPASATDNAVARYDGTTGKIIQNSSVTIADDGATVIAANSTTDGLRITQTGTGNALLVEDSANPDASPFVIDNAGNEVVGYTSALTVSSFTPALQIHGTVPSKGSLSLNSWQSGTDVAANLIFSRGDNGSINDYTLVGSGDSLGNVRFYGADGIAMVEAAKITAAVDGTPGTNDMPGRLVFSTTADGASSPTERMRINSAGAIGIGAVAQNASTVFIQRNGSGNATAHGIRQVVEVQSDVTSVYYGNLTTLSTQAASFTVNNVRYYQATQGTFGAGSTVNNQYGFFAESTLTGATNNYGFYSAIASGTGRYNFYANGTALNYFNGGVEIGRTAVTAPAATDGNVFSGTYTPTYTNVANVSASTSTSCQYMRVGNTVTVSGQITITPTASATLTSIRVSLPIASNFAFTRQCAGTFSAIAGTSATNAGRVQADATNDDALFDIVSQGTASWTHSFSFTYLVV
jgi:hypothetical protein